MEGEVIAARTMNSLYIWLDIAYLMILLGVLLWTKRRQAVIAGLIGGALYFAVDYGMFYLLLGTRQVVGADPFWFLLWLSISYGFTNFVWIWLWLDRDGHIHTKFVNPYLRVVNLNCCRLVGYCTAVTKFWKSIFANFYYAGYQ